jgi:hypothetical protein
LLIGAARYGQEFSFKWPEKLRASGCDLFDGVGGTHADDWVMCREACKNVAKMRGVSEHMA